MKKTFLRARAPFGFFLTTWLCVGCSFYSSAGRKQFEEKAPTQITAQTQSQAKNTAKDEALFGAETRDHHDNRFESEGYLLFGCRHLGSTEAWFVEELSKRSSEVLVKTALYEIRGSENAQREFEVTAVIPLVSSASAPEYQSCKYLFPSREAWFADRAEFLQELLNPNQDLD